MAKSKKDLLNLPNELLLDIADSVKRRRDLNALVRTNRAMHALLNGTLYRHDLRTNYALANGPVHERDPKKGPPGALYWAAKHGSVRTAELSVAQGADVNFPVYSTEGSCFTGFWHVIKHLPLELAIKGGHEEVAVLFLAHGAHVSTIFDLTSGRTPLHEASVHGLLSVMQALLDRGARVDACKGRRRSRPPLQLVFRLMPVNRKGDKAKTISMLLRHGAIITAEDLCTYTAARLLGKDTETGLGWTLPSIIGERRIYCLHSGVFLSGGFSDGENAAQALLHPTRAIARPEPNTSEERRSTEEVVYEGKNKGLHHGQLAVELINDRQSAAIGRVGQL